MLSESVKQRLQEELASLAEELAAPGSPVGPQVRDRLIACLGFVGTDEPAGEKRFRALVDKSADGIALMNRQGEIVWVSDSGIRLLGIEEKTLLGEVNFDLIHPADSDALRNAIQSVCSTQLPFARAEFRLRRDDRRWVWVEADFTNRFADPDINAAVVNFRDITETHRARQVLEVRNRQLEFLLVASQRFSQTLDGTALAHHLLALLAGEFGAEYARLLLLTGRKEVLILIPGTHEGTSEPAVLERRLEVSSSLSYQLNAVCSGHKPMWVPYGRRNGRPGDPLLRLLLESGMGAPETGGFLIVPLEDDGGEGIVAALALETETPHENTLGTMELLGTLYTATSANIRHYQVALAEIKAREAAEEAERRAKELAQGIQNAIPAHICVIDRDGFIIAANKGWRDFAHGVRAYSSAIAPGANYLDTCRAAAASDEEVRSSLAGIEAVLAGDAKRFEHEFLQKRKGAAPVRYRMIVSPFSGQELEGAVIMHLDVTERWLAEKALVDERTRFRIAAEAASDFIYDLDVTTGELLWFGQIDTALGYGPGEFPRTLKGWEDHVHPEDRARVVKELEEHFAEEGHFRSEYRMIRKDGKVRWWKEHGQSIRDARGRAVRMVGVATDVTEIREAEEALLRSEARLRSVFESEIVGIAIVDFEHRMVDGNDRFLEMIGANREAVAAGEVWCDTITAPEYQDRDRAAFDQMMERGTCDSYEKEYLRPDGTRLPVLVGGKVLTTNPPQVVYFVSDISELHEARRRLEEANKELESRVIARTAELQRQNAQQALLSSFERAINEHNELEKLLHALPGLIVEEMKLAAGCIVAVRNPYGEGYILVAGFPSGETLEVKREFRARLFPAAKDVEQSGKPLVYDRIEGHPFEADRHRFASCTGLPLGIQDDQFGVLFCYRTEPEGNRTLHGELQQLLARRLALAINKVILSERLRDRNFKLQLEVGQRIAAEKELAKAKEVAERANSAKSEFLSRMSHELRTPLNAVIGFAQLLEMSGLSEEQQKDLKHILRAGKHLLQLINEVLDIARIEAGRMAISPEPVMLRTVLRSAIDLLRPSLEERRIQVDWDVSGCEKTWVIADTGRLKQVFLNLLSNAIKYNREEGSIRLSCEYVTDDAVALYFEDTGIGIAPDKIARLFTPFDRLGAEAMGIEGSGLGLALSKRLLDVMKGSIEVSSEPGKGTTVRLRLVRAESPEAQEASSSAPSAGRSNLPELPDVPIRLVYIEDNKSNINLVSKILSLSGKVEIFPAETGAEGLELCQKTKPDIVLLDLNLPDISGYGVLNRLRAAEDTCRIPVVVISADATSAQVDRMMAAGARDYIVKPISVAGLLDALRKIIIEIESQRPHDQ